MSKSTSKSLKSIIKPKKLSNIKETSESSDSIESTEYNPSNIKINDLIYPCKDEILNTRVILHPYQMNNNLYVNLKKNLIDKFEGKCIKYGYIIKIYKILEYTNGIIEPENFTGSAVYDVKYLAKICVALKESTIVAKITSYIPNANFVLAEFGSIIKIIFTKNERDLNTRNFIIKNDKSLISISSQKKIGINDYVKIQLKSIKFYQNDTVIKCMGYLDDLATDDEINKFYYQDDNTLRDINYTEMQSSIYYNDDNDIEDTNIEESINQHQNQNINEI